MRFYKLLLGFGIIASSILACDSTKIEETKQENDRLQSETESKDSLINVMLTSFNQIQDNLNEIKRREGMIEIKSVDSSDNGTLELSINEDIELISKMMQENEQLIGKLQNQLSQPNDKVDQFRKLVEGMQQRLKDKNLEIAELNEALERKELKIDQLYFRVDSLSHTNQMKDKEIEQKIDEINKAYFAYGTFKELKDKNVLSKEGGFLGIGKTQELKNDFNQDYFSEIDMRKQKSFLIYADKAKLITTHPEESYQIMGSDDKVDSLVILDTEAFWKASKYLVIVID